MDHPPANPNQSLTTQSAEIRVLGQTGQTVVYLFPDGRALADREEPDFDSVQSSSSESKISEEQTPAKPISEEQILNELVAEGKITDAQKSVVIHDYERTNMTILEIITARGWHQP
ncbi:hypothetical protein PN498_28195 [Oscillatoria sp. CS-180]|uniref:hypothetical protein n=1 Tax=Oscillatoria sp. CS-180 TaxID=3021720 RepID=UPI0023314313|nr:hypothetical protein [Oscillatoria sp. CS-180]MDB9529900.1 hypothetical protein [Oscillatoria sp. CS-180]